MDLIKSKQRVADHGEPVSQKLKYGVRFEGKKA